MPKAIAIVSGGLDSITLAYLLHAEGYELHVLSFDYGQRHKKELAYAERCAKRLNVVFDIVDLSAVAVAEKAQVVAIGVHAGDHFIYPDCRPEFITSYDTMQRIATEGFGDPHLRLEAPFLHLGKHQIVQLGTTLQVPYADTWSCYKGEERHCGTCGTCFERKEAFEFAGIPDPTEYEGEGT